MAIWKSGKYYTLGRNNQRRKYERHFTPQMTKMNERLDNALILNGMKPIYSIPRRKYLYGKFSNKY